MTKILSSPAIGDLDGDGSPDIVEGTGEAYGSTPDTSGRVYASKLRQGGDPVEGVTGVVPARVVQGHLIEEALPLVELATVLLVALVLVA